MFFKGRKEIFRTLVGSHNYNLNTPESDKDYKVFVAPTYDDLYDGKIYSESIIGEDQDLDIHDIRKVSNLWWKANVNFLEVLFSEESKFGNNVDNETKIKLQTIFQHKNEIAKMNLPYLYDACIGMHHNKIKYLLKGTEGTQHLVDKYGYDTKQGLHAWRILDFLRRFSDTGFNDFKKAIWYEDVDNKRNFLLYIKNGEYTLDEYKQIVANTLNDVEMNWKSIYKSQKPNEETNIHLIRLVKEIVRINL